MKSFFKKKKTFNQPFKLLLRANLNVACNSCTGSRSLKFTTYQSTTPISNQSTAPPLLVQI